jgi:hypothetical protein
MHVQGIPEARGVSLSETINFSASGFVPHRHSPTFAKEFADFTARCLRAAALYIYALCPRSSSLHQMFRCLSFVLPLPCRRSLMKSQTKTLAILPRPFPASLVAENRFMPSFCLSPLGTGSTRSFKVIWRTSLGPFMGRNSAPRHFYLFRFLDVSLRCQNQPA